MTKQNGVDVWPNAAIWMRDELRSKVRWTLEERKARADLIEVYKIIHGISSVSFDTFFEFNSYGTTRGHSLKLMKKESVD